MAQKKLTACVVPSYQPYSAKDAGGTWSGFAVEMAKDVAKSLARRSRIC
jgi:Bacterial extracellular solute-binding proteins, family 3.